MPGSRERAAWLGKLDVVGAAGLVLGCSLGVALTLNGFHFEVITSNFWYLMVGLRETWKLAGLSFSLGFLAAVLLAVARESPFLPLRWAANAYVELLRGVPQLMVIFWVYFLVPTVSGRSINAYVAAVVALTGCAAAFLADVVRAGINSVSRGQVEGAFATGLTYLQTMTWVVLPQALRNMVPSLVNQFVAAFKATSLVYIIGVIEFFRAATIVNERDFKSLEVFTFVGATYFANCYCMSSMARYLERRLRVTQGGY